MHFFFHHFAVLFHAVAWTAFAEIVHVNLTVDVLRFDVTDVPIAFTTRAYNGGIPGPVIRVKQGDQLRITLTNKLGKDKSSSSGNTFQNANVDYLIRSLRLLNSQLIEQNLLIHPS